MMFSLSIDENLQVFIRMFFAFLAGGLIGYQREKAEKPAGLRNHILVCMGSTLITVVSIYGFGKNDSFTPFTRAEVMTWHKIIFVKTHHFIENEAGIKYGVKLL